MDKIIYELFVRYQEFFRSALRGQADMSQAEQFYAAAFIGASPAGINVAHNDEQFKAVMRQGFDYYRKIGTKDILLRGVRVTPIDERHGVAHVEWSTVYGRDGKPDVTIDFEVHYLIQQLGKAPKIFGWISGDEQAVLKQYGII